MQNIDNSVFIAEGARIVGDVTIGKDSSVWFNAVLRGDEDRIVVGEGSNIQDNCVIHCGQGYSTIVGNGVTVGHLALLHGCLTDLPLVIVQTIHPVAKVFGTNGIQGT